MSNRVRFARRPRMAFFVVIGILAAGLGWAASVFSRPFVKAAAMTRENERLEKQAAGMEIEYQELRKQHAILNTDAGMEREARRLGYLKPNESPLIIPNESRSDTRP